MFEVAFEAATKLQINTNVVSANQYQPIARYGI